MCFALRLHVNTRSTIEATCFDLDVAAHHAALSLCVGIISHSCMMNAGAWDGLYVNAYALGSAAFLGRYVSFLAFHACVCVVSMLMRV